MQKIYRTLLVIGLATSSGVVLNSCGQKPSVPAAKAKEAEIFTVQTAKVELAPMAAVLKVTGTLEGTKEATVSNEIGGRVTGVIHTIGDRVQNGTPVLKLDDELKAIAVQQAAAQRLAAEAALEKAQIDLKRTEQLYKDNAVTKSQLELAQLQVKSMDASLKGAQSAESLAKRQLADATIKAPFSGVISSRYVNLGEMLNQGTRVFTLVDDSKLKLRMNISEVDITSLKVGDKVSIHVDAVSNANLKGTVTAISSKADQARSYAVEVEIANGDHALKSGMFARAEVERESVRNVPSVPNAAIVNNGSKTQVYVVNNNTVSLRAVKIGATTQERVEILDGLNEGDEVVTFGQSRLYDGAKIRK